MKALQKYDRLICRHLVVTDGRIILVDEHLSDGARKNLEELETADGKEVLFLEDTELATGLEEFLAEIPRNTLLVFPGNGSNYPRKLSRVCGEFTAVEVQAKRCWIPGSNPVVTIGLIFPERFLVLGIESILVVDDVVSSGLTMRKLYQNNAWRFPGARWQGAAWISQLPQGNARSGIRGYDFLLVACLVRKTSEGRVPVNSLSTLRQNPEIAESYARRHFRWPEEFLRLISR